MALTVIDRPQGRKLATTGVTATVSDSSGTALFTKATHGLVDGDYIFIDSVFSAYNGYWYVDQISGSTFQIKEYATATAQAFVNSGSVTYYQSYVTHNWSCVHLPIIYKLSSNLWPINGADTARTVSSISDDAGYVNLNLSGDIKATGSAAELEFVKVVGANEGIYQIINWVSDSDITIDMPYSAGVSFSGSTVQYYYNNYHARIKIYAGLTATHTWADLKPYEEVVEITAVPDSNGIITVNISEYIKSKINIDKNDTTLDSLPNDIDSFCMFYIEVAEAYTYSNGYTLGTSVSSYTSDQGNFEGYAINAMLPFKTQSSGFMDDYVHGVALTSAEKFLTPIEVPSIFNGQYFDISFILNSTASGQYILEQYISEGLVVASTTTVINSVSNNQGVYRFAPTYQSETSFITSDPRTWTDLYGSWTSKTATDFNLIGSGAAIYSSYILMELEIGESINVGFTLTINSGANQISTSIVLVDEMFIASSNTIYLLSGTASISGTLTATAQTKYLYLYVGTPDIPPNFDFTITLDNVGGGGTVYTNDYVDISLYDSSNNLLSEVKRIRIDTDCSAYYTDLVWKNHLGGHDYWRFNAGNEYTNSVKNKEVETNIFSNWPKSWGKFADTVRKNSMIEGVKNLLIRSQFVTNQQAEDMIFGVENSLLVQIQTSDTEKRTVLVSGSNKIDETDKLVELQFRLKYTDNNPVQKL